MRRASRDLFLGFHYFGKRERLRHNHFDFLLVDGEHAELDMVSPLSGPRVEGRLHEELDRVLDSRLPAVADLKSLSYTESAIAEALLFIPLSG
jgi:hypothetical protein